MDGLRKLGDVVAGIAERAQRPAVWQPVSTIYFRKASSRNSRTVTPRSAAARSICSLVSAVISIDSSIGLSAYAHNCADLAGW